MNKKGMGAVGWVAVIVIGLIALSSLGILKIPTGAGSSTPATAQAPSAASGVQCQVAPAYTYIGRDSLNGVTAGGTVRMKANGNAPTTSTTPPAGAPMEFWLQNTTGMFCDIAKTTADCGNQVLQSSCYRNGTVSLAVYSEPAHTALSSTTTTGAGATNVSIAANGNARLTLTYQGTAKQSNYPFGGCLVLEYPNTVSTVTLTGAGITEGCKYQYTYSPAATTNIYKMFTIPDGFDKNGAGDIKSLDIQIQNGGTDITAGNLIATFQAANHYVGNDGNFYMGIEQDKNGLNTKVGDNIVYAVAIS